MHGISEFRKRDVIDAKTARRLGIVSDFEIDLVSGRINSIIVPKHGILSFIKREEYIIPWENITAIGKDIILVNLSDTNNILPLG